MSWFYMAITTVVVCSLAGFERLAELMLAAACVIGYLDARVPRNISVNIVRSDNKEAANASKGGE